MSAANPPPLPLWPANVRALAFTIDLLPKTPQASPRHIGCFEGQLCLCRCPELGRVPFQRPGAAPHSGSCEGTAGFPAITVWHEGALGRSAAFSALIRAIAELF